MNIYTLVSRIIRKEDSLVFNVLLFPLWILSQIYAVIHRLRVNFYKHGILKTKKLTCPVISIGNITVGGTGKTPTVEMIAQTMKAKGIKVGILSRGYKGSGKKKVNVVSDGEQVFLDAQISGDEPFMLAKNLGGVSVLTGKDRHSTGEFAIKNFKTQLIVLDDGYQHLQLKRDLNIVVINTADPFGNGHLIPRGILREPLKYLDRADVFLLTKTNQINSINTINKIEEILCRYNKKAKIFKSVFVASALEDFIHKKDIDIDLLRGKNILSFSGIANSGSFAKFLEDLGAKVIAHKKFPDHYQYSSSDLCKLAKIAHSVNAEAVVTTEKDIVRILEIPSFDIPLWVLKIRNKIVEKDDEWEKLLMGAIRC